MQRPKLVPWAVIIFFDPMASSSDLRLLKQSAARVQHSPFPTCCPILALTQPTIRSPHSSDRGGEEEGGGKCFCSALAVTLGAEASQVILILVVERLMVHRIANIKVCLVLPDADRSHELVNMCIFSSMPSTGGGSLSGLFENQAVEMQRSRSDGSSGKI